MSRKITLDILDEWDAAAAEHGDGKLTVEQVIQDRMVDLVRSANGVRLQKEDAKFSQLPSPSQDLVTALRDKNAKDVTALIDAEYAKLPPPPPPPGP